MRFNKRLGGILHSVGAVLVGLSVNQVTGAVPEVPNVLPDAVAPWLAIAVPILQGLIGQKAFEHNHDGSNASLPAPPRVEGS